MFWWTFLAKLDYSGICFLITGGMYPFSMYVFACDEVIFARNFFMAFTTILSSATMITLMNSKYATPKYRALRGSLLFAMGLSPIFPPLYLTILDLEPHLTPYNMQPYLLGLFTVSLGTVCFLKRWPECIYPGKFDMIGSSHQLFHASAVIACAIIHRESVNLYEARKNKVCPI